YYGNDHFWHETDESLNLQDIESVATVLAYITLVAACFLIAPAAECMAAVFRTGTFSREQHDPYRRIFGDMVEGIVKYGGGMGTEGIAHLGSVDCNPGHSAGFLVGNIFVFFYGSPVDHFLKIFGKNTKK